MGSPLQISSKSPSALVPSHRSTIPTKTHQHQNPINPPDDTKGTINNSGVTVSPAVWKQLQNLLAMHPGPSPSTTSNLDQSYPSENPFDSSNPIEDEDTNDNSNSGSNSEEFLPDDILESLNVTGYRDGHQKKAACFVDQDLKSLETNSASDLPTLITDPQSYDFTTGEPMEPPPVTRFLTKDDLLRFCQLWAKTHGYAPRRMFISVAIEEESTKARRPINQAEKQLVQRQTARSNSRDHTTSKKITNKTWTLEVQEGTHNHDPSPGASSHAAHRKLQPDQVLELRCLFKSNIKPAQMLLQLRTSDDQTLATNKTITNMLQKFRREDLDGKTPIEALVYVLKETNWSWEVKVNDSGQIQNLFFAHPGSIHLARINHHVALLDATYKTNRYKIPLLHVIGQAASNRSLSIAFCFLTYEDDDNYLWAVQVLKKLIWKPDRIPKVFITDRDTALRNALADVFPHSQANLCTWHINKNITTNCRKYFPSIEPPAKSGTKRKAAKKSVDGKLEKDKPVDPWKQFMGLWNWVTYAKSPELYTRRFQNLKVFLSTRPAFDWGLAVGISGFGTRGRCSNLSSSRIHRGNGSIDRLKNNFDPTEPCSQTLTTGVGIPCAHQIAEILKSGSTLTPDDFHSQWSLKYNPEFTHEEEPEIDLDHEIRKLTIALSDEPPTRLGSLFVHFHRLVARTHTVVALQAPAVKENTKGRPNSKKQAAKSTKRLPSAFEVAEADFKKAESSKKRAAKSSAPHKSKRSKKTKDDEVLSHTDLTDEESDVEGSVDYELKDKSDGNESENEENNESENEENNESENEQNNENTNKQENEEAKKNKNIKEEENKKIQEDSNKNKEDDDNKTLSNGEKVFNPIGDGNCGFVVWPKPSATKTMVGFECDKRWLKK
ncbi:hypothetical protein PSTT_01140 [Puccinia striiformis]|uniref:MULE transposase domain-containing protein n=1 Tax=Puccinia striiformis TaxID=27350 RepID=A0A2S4W4F1_9BASI|nr:hypothetical protein PSTT_01140 [Puccinia striiformis]